MRKINTNEEEIEMRNNLKIVIEYVINNQPVCKFGSYEIKEKYFEEEYDVVCINFGDGRGWSSVNDVEYIIKFDKNKDIQLLSKVNYPSETIYKILEMFKESVWNTKLEAELPKKDIVEKKKLKV